MLKSLENAVDKVNSDLTGVNGVAEIIGVSQMYTRRLLPEAPVETVEVHGRTFYVVADVEKWADAREKETEAKEKARAEKAEKKATSTRSGPTLKELRAEAKKVGIKGYHRLKKAELVAAIEAGPTEEKSAGKSKAETTEKPLTLAQLRKRAKELAEELGVDTPKGNKAKIQAWIEAAEAGEIEAEPEGDEDDTELSLEDMLAS